VQVPLVDAPSAAEQTSHEPAHALLQQNPSTQLPLVHCELDEQLEPVARVPVQWLVASQKLPAPHCAAVVQVV
jgi:hypothetical protein